MDPKHWIKFLTSVVERRGSGDEEKEKEKKEDEEEGEGEDKDDIGELQSKTEVHNLLHIAPTEKSCTIFLYWSQRLGFLLYLTNLEILF